MGQRMPGEDQRGVAPLGHRAQGVDHSVGRSLADERFGLPRPHRLRERKRVQQHQRRALAGFRVRQRHQRDGLGCIGIIGEEPPEHLREFGFLHFARRDPEHRVFQSSLGVTNAHAV